MTVKITNWDELYNFLDEHFIAWKLWTEEDVKAALENNDYPATQENIDTICNSYNILSRLSDATDNDWAIIDEAIASNKDNLLK